MNKKTRSTTVIAVRKNGKIAMAGDGQVTMGETVNEVSIERVSDTKAKFIVDGIFTWNIDFTPGRGFTMLNGQVVGESTNELGNKVYIATVLAADDFTPEHKNTLVGSREPVHLNIADDGSLVFTQAQLIAPGQTWASYDLLVRMLSR